MLGALVEYLNIELPTLDMFSSFLACDDNYELGDLAANHPFVQLRHDFLDVGFDLVIRRDYS
jgi:hypothetical protein